MYSPKLSLWHRQRNREIFRQYQAGTNVEDLSFKYGLSHDYILNVILTEREFDERIRASVSQLS